MQYEIFIIVFLLLLIPLLNNRSRLYLNIINKRRKRGKQNMPTELIKNFIGKVCSVAMFNDSFGAQGKITAAEENWIMLTDKKGSQKLINGDMVSNITVLPEKQQW